MYRAFPFVKYNPLIRSKQSQSTGEETGAFTEILHKLSKLSQLIRGRAESTY